MKLHYNSNSTNFFTIGIIDGTETERFAIDRYGDVKIDTDTLYVDASENRVGIGTDTPQRELEIHGAGNVFARITASTDNDSAALELNNNGNELWTLKADDTASDAFKITCNGGTALTIDTSKNTTFNGDVLGTGAGNRITNNGTPYLLSGDAAATLTLQDVCDNGNTTTTAIGIGTGSPGFKLDVVDSNGGALARFKDSEQAMMV